MGDSVCDENDDEIELSSSATTFPFGAYGNEGEVELDLISKERERNMAWLIEKLYMLNSPCPAFSTTSQPRVKLSLKLECQREAQRKLAFPLLYQRFTRI